MCCQSLFIMADGRVRCRTQDDVIVKLKGF